MLMEIFLQRKVMNSLISYQKKTSWARHLLTLFSIPFFAPVRNQKLAFSKRDTITTNSSRKFIIELNIPLKCFFLCVSNFPALLFDSFDIFLEHRNRFSSCKNGKLFPPLLSLMSICEREKEHRNVVER